MQYWRGLHEAGGIRRPRPVRVLVYHAVRDLAHSPLLKPYGVPAYLFCQHLDLLRKIGFQFISADEFLDYLHFGHGLPRRPILLTFDDGYKELSDVVEPILHERKISAVVFVVSGHLGGTNEWDTRIGAPPLRLLDTPSLKKLEQRGFEIGAHSRTHPHLSRISEEELAKEINNSIVEIEEVGLKRPRMFAYPYGDHDHKTQKLVQEAGLEAAFTTVHGRVYPRHNVYKLPRIEILRHDTGFRFLWKLLNAGRIVRPSRKFLLSLVSVRRPRP